MHADKTAAVGDGRETAEDKGGRKAAGLNSTRTHPGADETRTAQKDGSDARMHARQHPGSNSEVCGKRRAIEHKEDGTQARRPHPDGSLVVPTEDDKRRALGNLLKRMKADGRQPTTLQLQAARGLGIPHDANAEASQDGPGNKSPVTSKSLTGGPRGDKDPSGGPCGDKDPSGGPRGDKDPSGGLHGDKDPSGGLHGDKDPLGGLHGDKDPSGGPRGDKGPSGGPRGDKGPSGGPRGDKDPSGGPRGDKDPSGTQEPETSRTSRKARRPRRFLIVFSGDQEKLESIAACLRERGVRDDEIEQVDFMYGDKRDMLKADQILPLLERIAWGEFDAIFLAPPCSSFSIAHEDGGGEERLKMRSKLEALGVKPPPAGWEWYLIKHNALADSTIDIMLACDASGTPWLVENPPGKSKEWGDAAWPDFDDWACLWDVPRMMDFDPRACDTCQVVFPQCAKRSPFQAWTCLRGSRHFDGDLQTRFGGLTCSCKSHARVARGRSEQGASNSREKVYPMPMCEDIADLLVDAAMKARQDRLDLERPRLVQVSERVAEIGPVFISESEADKASVRQAEWRAALTIFVKGQVDIERVASSAGAGWRLGPGKHVPQLKTDAEALRLDPLGEKRIYAIEKLVAKSKSIPRSDHPVLDWMIAAVRWSRLDQLQLHVGSAKPHDKMGKAPQYSRKDRWAPSASMRQLEPESASVLRRELLPATNTPITTKWEEPPQRDEAAPGPFTTSELIPEQVRRDVEAYAKSNDKMHSRAMRGSKGWQVAKGLREDPLVYTEREALNECGWGHVWRRRDNEDLWDVVQPSRWPEDPPDTDLKIKRCVDDAFKYGYPDKQQTSWTANGYPGAREMERKAVVSHSHVGAIKETEVFIKCAEKDVKKGFVTAGHSFPDVWPCMIDPMNVVIQRGKPRLCIDKSLSLGWERVEVESDVESDKEEPREEPPRKKQKTKPTERPKSTAKPVTTLHAGRKRKAEATATETGAYKWQRVKAYNSYVDLVKDKADGVRVTLPRIWQAARSTAILKSSGYPTRVGKFDLSSFFRVHGKQRAHLWQGGRLVPKLGYGTDLRENFGGADTPDHDCRESNFLAFRTRQELLRLDKEYPPTDQELQLTEYLEERRELALTESDGEIEEYRIAALFYVMYYVDDAYLSVISTPLCFDGDSTRPMLEHKVDSEGTKSLVPVMRADMYYDVACRLAQHYGHETPEDKMSRMDLWVVFLGSLFDTTVDLRLLDIEKRGRYLEDLEAVYKGKFHLKDGRIVSDKDETGSLQSKLQHTLENIPAGRLRLYYIRRDLKADNKLDTPGNWTILSKESMQELDWWREQLQRSSRHGIPLATRYSFPSASSPTHLIEYHDASRNPSHEEPSGWGAWGIIEAPAERVFAYIYGEWTWQEVDKHSINVFESKTRDMAVFTFVEYAKTLGCDITHTTGFNDNTCAQFNAEFGRPGTELLKDMLQERYDRLQKLNIFAANERCASIDNTIADDLSRGAIEAALAVPRLHGIKTVRLHVKSELRAFPRQRRAQ